MIRVTRTDGGQAFVNILTVAYMLQRDDRTTVVFTGDGELFLDVHESAEQILQLLNPTLSFNIPTKPLPNESVTPEPQLTSREVLIKACAKDRGAVNKLLATHGVTKLSEASEEVQALVIAELRTML
jgi:hypothetical protein